MLLEFGRMRGIWHLPFRLLYSNFLSGTLPTEWSSLTNLLEMSVFFFFSLRKEKVADGWIPGGSTITDNQLTGTLPSEWASLTALGYLFAFFCFLQWRDTDGIILLLLAISREISCREHCPQNGRHGTRWLNCKSLSIFWIILCQHPFSKDFGSE